MQTFGASMLAPCALESADNVLELATSAIRTMPMTEPFRSVAVVGAGAVGSFFGGMLARAGHGDADRAPGARAGDRARPACDS